MDQSSVIWLQMAGKSGAEDMTGVAKQGILEGRFYNLRKAHSSQMVSLYEIASVQREQSPLSFNLDLAL